MSQTKTCQKCGATLPVEATAGLCPCCLMAAVAAPTNPDSEPAAPQKTLSPEELAPHFPQLEILEFRGRGGMGVVYKARQKTLNRLVALKLLAPERVRDPQFAERFTREAQALAALNHPNIVTIHDFGQAGGFYYLLMEFVDGVNLRQLLRARKFTPEEALAIVPPICDALQFAHERGIVHRDIKPENLLLDKAGRLKIADFGIAKMLGTAEAGRGSGGEAVAPEHGTGSVVGTPGYSAPEQKDSPQRVDSRADIYSLGVVFYEMLTGELPGKPIEPPSRKVQIDVRLDEVVLHALEKEPERRYQTAAAVKTAVETIATTPPPPASPPETPVGTGGSPVREQPSTQPRFSRTAIVGAAWVPLVLAALAAVMITTPEPLGPHVGPSAWHPNLLQSPFAFLLLPLGVTAPFGTTILGWIAVAQIRRSVGRLYGLGLAVADGLLFPLLALDALIFAVIHAMTGNAFHGSYLALSLLVCFVFDWRIAWFVWRGVNRPLDGASGSTVARPPVTALVLERARWLNVVRAVILCVASVVLGLQLPPIFGIPLVVWGLVGWVIVASKSLGSRRNPEEDRAALITAGRVGLIHAIGILAAALIIALNNSGLSKSWNVFFAVLLGIGIIVSVLKLAGLCPFWSLLLPQSNFTKRNLSGDAPSPPTAARPHTESRGRIAQWFARCWKTLLFRDLPLALVLALVLRAFVIGNYRAETDAVSPEIPRGSWMFVYKLARTFERGDVVAYWRDGKVLAGRVAEAGPRDGVVQVQRRQKSPESIAAADIIGKVVFNTRAGKPAAQVVGVVTDFLTGKPIVGARVDDNFYGARRNKAPQQAWTDTNGCFALKTWPEEHNIAASAPGYETKLVTLTTSLWGTERTARIDFQLQPRVEKSTDGDFAGLSFGPLIERVVRHNRLGPQLESMIDLDTGRLITPPTPRKANWDWVVANGVDAFGDTGADVRGLVAIGGTVVMPVARDAWNRFSPFDVRQIVVPLSSTLEGGVAMSGTGELPAVFVFKTREGGMGILQITGFTDDPPGVKLRYKLVQAGNRAVSVSALSSSRSDLTLGPAIERALNDPDDDVRNSFMDLDSGTVFDCPVPWPKAGASAEFVTGFATGVRESFTRAVREKKIDVLSDASGHSLIALDMVVAPFPNEQFEEVSASQIVTTAALSGRPQNETTLTVTNPPSTFLFKTREGGMGVLQIVSFTDKEPRNVKIRYKLVQRLKTGESPSALIERVVVSKQRALIKGLAGTDSQIVFNFGNPKNNWSYGFTNATYFTASIERAGREINCLVTGSGGKLLLSTTVTQMGQMKIDQDRIVFREGTVTAEPDGSFVIGEFRPETGAPLPIKVCLEKVSNATTPNQKP